MLSLFLRHEDVPKACLKSFIFLKITEEKKLFREYFE